MVYNGKPYSNGWFGGTTIFGNTHIDNILCLRVKNIQRWNLVGSVGCAVGFAVLEVGICLWKRVRTQTFKGQPVGQFSTLMGVLRSVCFKRFVDSGPFQETGRNRGPSKQTQGIFVFYQKTWEDDFHGWLFPVVFCGFFFRFNQWRYRHFKASTTTWKSITFDLVALLLLLLYNVYICIYIYICIYKCICMSIYIYIRSYVYQCIYTKHAGKCIETQITKHAQLFETHVQDTLNSKTPIQ